MNKFAIIFIITLILVISNLNSSFNYNSIKKPLEQIKQAIKCLNPYKHIMDLFFVSIFVIGLVTFVVKIIIKKREMDQIKNQVNQLPQPIKINNSNSINQLKKQTNQPPPPTKINNSNNHIINNSNRINQITNQPPQPTKINNLNKLIINNDNSINQIKNQTNQPPQPIKINNLNNHIINNSNNINQITNQQPQPINNNTINHINIQTNQQPQPININNSIHNIINNNSNNINPYINDAKLVNKFNQDLRSTSLALPRININQIKFSNVYLGKGSIEKAMYMGKEVAIKNGKKFDNFTFNEIKCHMVLAGHKNIVDIYGFFERDMSGIPSFVLELLDISLIDYLIKYRSYLRGQHHSMYKVIFEILDGVDYMHLNGFVHGDLHPGNILLKNIVRNASGAFGPTQVKISHFSHSRYLPYDTLSNTSSIGCQLFMSPEFSASGGKVCEKSDDVYSVAIIVWLVFSFLSDGENINSVFDKFLSQGVSALEYKVLPLHLVDIIKKCIGPRQSRPSIQQFGFEVSIARARAVQEDLTRAIYR